MRWLFLLSIVHKIDWLLCGVASSGGLFPHIEYIHQNDDVALMMVDIL